MSSKLFLAALNRENRRERTPLFAQRERPLSGCSSANSPIPELRPRIVQA
jgi:hypothetical protein